MDIDHLRRLAVGRSFFQPTTLASAIATLGFVQADPIRAPARAQDLTLRHRVEGYVAGDLERAYAGLPVEEDVFVNYGFLSRSVHALMHPRAGAAGWAAPGHARVRALLAFVCARGAVHPREVDAHFSHGTVTNYWGGSSSATTHLLDGMHYRGLIRVARRDAGIRVYEAREPAPPPATAAEKRARLDALVDVVVGKYAPLPGPSLSSLVGRLRYAVPQWRSDIPGALKRARKRLAHARVDDVDWYWPAGEAAPAPVPDTVRLLAPFDPVVWDRRRFELFWGWAYRFEAYTPRAKRQLGYYALPLLWRERVVGWGNLAVADGRLIVDLGYVTSRPPRDRGFKPALEEELDRMRAFLAVNRPAAP